MEWVAISGGWHVIDETVEHDVASMVSLLLQEGKGIVTGGALGVDYLARQAVIDAGLAKERLRVLIPSSFTTYKEYYELLLEDGVIMQERFDKLLTQMKVLHEAGIVEEGDEDVLDRSAFFRRSDDIVSLASRLVAFLINKSGGTQYTITKARERDIPVRIFSYAIED